MDTEGSRRGIGRTVASRPITAYLVTAAAALWATRSFWWPGRYVVGYDAYTYSGPNLRVTADGWRAGRIPLWNDAIFGGVTHLGNFQTGALYPPHLIALLVEENRALGLLSAAHVVLLGTGMVALARRFGLGVPASAFVGVTAVLNGAVLIKATQVEQISVLGWTPWILVVVHVALTGRRVVPAIAATAAVTAAILLAGHPQMVYETIVLAIALTVGLAATGGRWRRLPVLAAGVALGALVALPQLVASAVATSQSIVRVGRDQSQLLDVDLSLVPGTAAQALFGSVRREVEANFRVAYESIAPVGVLLAGLAFIGLVDGVRRDRSRAWTIALSVAAGVGLIWATGPRTALFRLATDVLPGFDLARVSARWLVVVALVCCLLAGAGLEALSRGLDRRALGLLVGAVVVSGIAIAWRHLDGASGAGLEWLAAGAVLVSAGAASTLRPRPRPTVVAGAIAALAIGVLATMADHGVVEQLATDTPFTSDTYRTATTEWLQGRPGYVISFTDDLRGPEYVVPALRPNANVLVDLRSIDGYDGGVQVTDRWAAALRRINPDPEVDFPLRSSAIAPLDPVTYARLGVRYVLIDRSRPIGDLVPGWVGPQATDATFEVWENPAWVGEAIAWSYAEVVAPDDAPDLLREAGDELVNTALPARLEPPLTCDAPDAASCAQAGLDLERRTPEHVIVHSDSDHRTLVTLDQQYDDGWHVTIDGRTSEVLEVDGLVLGVDVPAGPHTIEWRYRPRWLTPTEGIAVTAVLAVVVLALAPTVTARRRRVRSTTT